MPSTGAVPVVEGLASSAPCSIRTPSNPTLPPAPEDPVLVVWGLLAVLELDEVVLELDEELLLPQPATNSARVMIAIVHLHFTGANGSWW